MASLSDVRTNIVDSIQDTAVSDAELVADTLEDWTFDDEDFWEALDMMETSCQIIQDLLRRCHLGEVRRREVENHCDDLKQFTGEFIGDVEKVGEGL